MPRRGPRRGSRNATPAPPTSGVPVSPGAPRHSLQPPVGRFRRAANCSVTPWGSIADVTAAAIPLTADDASAPVRRSRAERQAIVLDTAERLFASRSSRSVGMDELVRETGLGKMTVYRLFKSKDDAVERDVTRTGFRGCPFNNVSSEYDDPQHPARSAAADYKFELYSRLERLAEEIVPGRGEDLAAQIHLIVDGMYLSGGLLGPDGPAAHGRKLAERLIDVALADS